MWCHIGCIDVKAVRVTLQCVSRPHRSAWHTCNVISHVEWFVLSYKYFSKYVCSAPYVCFVFIIIIIITEIILLQQIRGLEL